MSLLAKIFRTERLPAGVRAALDRDERVTGWGSTDDGGAVVATTLGIWLPGPGAHADGEQPDGEQPSTRRRVLWHDIHKATWDDGVLMLVPAVQVEPGVVIDGPALTLRLADPRDLPAEVRARVTRSVAYSTYHPLPGGGVRIVGRRVAGQDGLTWVLRFDDGVDRTDPAVRDAATQLLNEARAQVQTSP